MDLMDGAPVKVFASVNLNTIKVEQALLDSVSAMSKSSERLCVVLEKSMEKYEKPLSFLIISISSGIILFSGAYFVKAVGDVVKSFRNKE